jgi:hypothetical protein
MLDNRKIVHILKRPTPETSIFLGRERLGGGTVRGWINAEEVRRLGKDSTKLTICPFKRWRIAGDFFFTSFIKMAAHHVPGQIA